MPDPEHDHSDQHARSADRFAEELEAVDQRIADANQDAGGEDVPLESELAQAAGVLELINRVRTRDPATDQDRGDHSDTAAEETMASDRPASDHRPRNDPSGVSQQVGPYEILEQIARGGMGIVFRARDTQLNRIVALKMMLAGPFAYQEERSRFRVEAEAAAQLDHPGIVPVYDVGDHSGQLYFTMRFVDGESLSERIRREPLDANAAASIAVQIAAAVGYAHAEGVVHRDIKPANVLLDPGGRPRLTDFGLARRTDSDSDLTRTEQVLGTPSYMAPEQALGQTGAAGPLADIYSMGANLYCMLTGGPPFQAAGTVETLRMVIEQEPLSPHQHNPSIPTDLTTICLKCLQKEPHRRYQSADELEADLRRFLDGAPIKARPIGWPERTWKWSRRHPLVASLSAAITVSLLAIVAGGAWYQTQLGETVGQLTRSRADTVDQLYQTLSNEAEFLNEVRPLGFGARVDEIVGEARQLDSREKDLNRLRQIYASSLGQVGARKPTVLPELEANVTAANVTADSRFVLLGLESGKLLVFGVQDGQKVEEVDLLDDPIIRIDVDLPSNDPTLQTIRTIGRFGRQSALWKLHAGGKLELDQRVRRDDSDFLGIEPTPDGRLLVGVQPASKEMAAIKHWVTRSTGVFHYQLGGPQRQGTQSGSYFAVASLTDPSQPIRRTEIPASPRFGVSDRFLAVGYSWLDGNENENTVSVYNHQTGELEIEIDPAGGTLLNVAISPDEYYIACTGEHAVEVFWRLTGERVGGWDKVPSSVVDTFIPHPDNFFINRDIIVRNRRESIWYSLDHRQPVARFTHLDNPAVLQFSSGGRYAIWTGTRHSQFVDLFGRECLRVPVDGRMASWVSFSPDARFLMATGEFHDDRSITTVCDAHSGRSLYEFPGVRSSFSPDGKWIANWTGRRAADTQTTNVLTQRELHLWDVRTGEVAATARCPFYPSCVLFSGDGNLVAASGFLPGHFAVWRVTAGEIPRDKTVTREVKLEQVFSDPKASGSMAISRSGDRIAYVIDQGVRIHHFRDEQLSTTIGLGQRPGQQSLAFVDDDHLLVLAGKLQLWNVSTGKLQYESGQSHQPPLVLSPDRKHLFCRRKLIRTSDFVTLLELPGRVDRVWVAQWSPDGRRLALGLDGGEVGIWNLQTIETLLHERSLPATGIEFVERSKMESFDQLVRIGRSATDRSDQYQWDLRYYELMEVLSRDQPDRNTWLTELAWLCERFDREVWQPFFDSSPSGVDRAWLNRIDRGYDLAMRLQEIKEYDQQKDLLRSMQSSFEGIDSPTPEMKRKISLVYHTSGDLHNFFLPDPQLCMAAYQSEERLLSELLDGADPPLTRAALASNLFWMNRNLALILRRGGESDKAIGRIDRALQVHEEFRDLPFPRQVVEDGYKTLIQWLRESEREAEVGAIINRQHEAKR